jgi:hypothetical protein
VVKGDNVRLIIRSVVPITEIKLWLCIFEERKWIQDERDIQYFILDKDVPVFIRECVCITVV